MNSFQDWLSIPLPTFNACGLKIEYSEVYSVKDKVHPKLLREVNDNTKLYYNATSNTNKKFV